MTIALRMLLPTTLALVVAAGSGGAAAAPSGATPRASATTDYGPVIAQLRTEVAAEMARSGAVGMTIALVDGARVVWTEGFGLADKAARRPVTADTLFHIGSASKTLSALAVMQLVQRGLVDLDKPLATYVPGFALLPRFKGNVVTVRTVLDHHSGIPGDVFNGLITAGRPDPAFREWLLKALTRMYPERPVNTEYAYNNSGYVLLQNLVETVSRMPFEAYAQKYLFGPMGMASSRFDDRAAPASRLTRNYAVTTAADGAVTGVVAEPREYVNGWTAGSVTSSARDMAQYIRTLLAGGLGSKGRVISASTLRQMWTAQMTTPLDIAPFQFGLGFGLGDPTLAWAGRVVWHDGATVWNFTMLRLLPDAGLGVFVSTNTLTDGAPSATIANRALTLAMTAKTGRTPPPAERLPALTPATPDPAAVAAVAGTYAGSLGLSRVRTTATGLELVSHASEPGEVAHEFTPTAEGWYVDPAGDVQLQFRTVEGRRLLVVRDAAAGVVITRVAAERLPRNTITAAWRARLGTYRAVDRVPTTDPSLVAETITLRYLDGVLVADMSSEAKRQALVVGTGGAAFTFGTGAALGRGKGECLIPFVTDSGVPGFTYLGVRYVRTAR